MERTTLGKTGLEVSRLGAGLAEIGSYGVSLADGHVARVLNVALDGGINFLDTAACYGSSEELIGHAISHRRQEYILATKCGDVAGGYSGSPWSADTVRDSIDRSLTRMKTDYLDLVQLHSCDVSVLERGEATGALLEAKEAGKTRFVGYSGDGVDALWAIESGLFDTLQTSFNLVDQEARTMSLPVAKARGMGVIVKRPIANGAWGRQRSPSGYAAEYFRRAQKMAQERPIPGAPSDSILLALGFVLAHDEVDTAIVGTGNPTHMEANIKLMDSLPISGEAVDELRRRFDAVGGNWGGRE